MNKELPLSSQFKNDIFDKVKQLEDEIDRLKKENLNLWDIKIKLHYEKEDSQRKDKIINELNRRISNLDKDIQFWKKATKYNQKLNNSKKIRHIPIYNSVVRSKYKESDIECPERVFLRKWRKENDNRAGINHGHGALELILSENSNECAFPITQRDASIAATVIQWLGTNCGRCFVEECQKIIKDNSEKRRAIAKKKWEEKKGT